MHDHNDRLPALLAAIGDLTHRLNVDVIAEGIEDTTDLQLALAAGFHLAQGLLFAPALPPNDAAAWVIPDTPTTTPA